MSKSKAIGTKLKLGDKVVGGLKSINGVEITAEAIDVSALDNADGYREKLPGLKDAGKIDDALHAAPEIVKANIKA